MEGVGYLRPILLAGLGQSAQHFQVRQFDHTKKRSCQKDSGRPGRGKILIAALERWADSEDPVGNVHPIGPFGDVHARKESCRLQKDQGLIKPGKVGLGWRPGGQNDPEGLHTE